MRWPITAFVIALSILGAVGSYWAAYSYFKGIELDRAEARLSLYRNTVLAELERFSHLTFVLARDPVVISTAAGSDTAILNSRMRAFADRAGLDAIYLMNMDGVTVAASNAGTNASFVGQDYSFRPYFRTAIEGSQGQFYGIGATTGIPGYFYADAVRGQSGALLGVVAIKIDLTTLQDSWRQAAERVLLVNADGVVILASNPAWLYRTLTELSENQRAHIQDTRQFIGQDLPPLDWEPSPRDTASLGAERYLYLTSHALPNDWALHYFAPDDQAAIRAWLAAGSLVLALGLAFITMQTLRTRRIGAALERSEQEEAALRLANVRLAVEIEERRSAEQRLKKTQSELERAGRLAALGQLSASVTHELGQPISAMKNHLAAVEIQSGTSLLTDRLQGLVNRMEGITRQLKFFARKGRDQFEDLDLRDVVQAVFELMDPTLKAAEISAVVTLPSDPIVVHGNRLRLEQVATNLLRNALDAMADQPAPDLRVAVFETNNKGCIEVMDNGHGLGDQSLDDLREPFRTTRESGQGMGLGLTISAGIMDDHSGALTASNRSHGGAVFRASLPLAAPSALAAQ